MRIWTALLAFFLSATSNAAVITFTWDGPMYQTASGNAFSASWLMSIDSEAEQFTELSISSPTLSFSLMAPAAIFGMAWESGLSSYYGASSPVLIANDGTEWRMNMYEFWIPTLAEVQNPYEAIPDFATPSWLIFHLTMAPVDMSDEWAYNGHVSNLEVLPPTAPSVPEPATLALLGLGLAGIGWRRI